MRTSPSIIPGIDRDVFLALDDFGRMGCAWRETNVEDAATRRLFFWQDCAACVIGARLAAGCLLRHRERTLDGHSRKSVLCHEQTCKP